MTKTIQQLAKEVCDSMIYDEEKEIYHQKVCGDPKWIQDMIHDCHYNGMLPDDYVFEWVYKFCEEISNLNEDEDPLNIEVHSDDYTRDLLKWLSSNLDRIDFMEDAINEYWDTTGKCDFVCFMGIAQEKEMQEVLWTVIDKLQNRLDRESENETK